MLTLNNNHRHVSVSTITSDRESIEGNRKINLFLNHFSRITTTKSESVAITTAIGSTIATAIEFQFTKSIWSASITLTGLSVEFVLQVNQSHFRYPIQVNQIERP